jgi:hypothetical protein
MLTIHFSRFVFRASVSLTKRLVLMLCHVDIWRMEKEFEEISFLSAKEEKMLRCRLGCRQVQRDGPRVQISIDDCFSRLGLNTVRF